MGCYLEEHRARVGTWAARFSWRTAVGHVRSRGGKTYMGTVTEREVVIANLLITGRVELNPRPGLL
jgi:hypothetical protein